MTPRTITRDPSPPDVLDGGSLEGVHLQHVHEERGHGAVEVLRDVKHSPTDLLEQGGDVLVVKGQSATQEGIEDDTTAPDVHLWASIEPARGQGQEKAVTTSPSSVRVQALCHPHPLLSSGFRLEDPLPAPPGTELQPTPGLLTWLPPNQICLCQNCSGK